MKALRETPGVLQKTLSTLTAFSIPFSFLVFNSSVAFAASGSILNTDEDTSTEVIDVYTGDTLQFTAELAEGESIHIGKYISPTATDLVEMTATPTLNESGFYELPLSVTNEGLELTDFTPGNYAIGVGATEDAVDVIAEFNVLSRYTDAQIDIEDEDNLFINTDMVFTSTYELKNSGSFEATPETAAIYEAHVSIHKLNGNSIGSSVIYKMKEGSFSTYTLEDGTYTIPLDESKFEAGKYFVVVYALIYDGSPEEIEYSGKVANIFSKEFIVKDVVSASLSPDTVTNPEIGQSIDFQTSFEVTNGTDTETVSTIPSG